MAAPSNKTFADMSGRWGLNKSISDPTEPILALQGLGWVTRKAIGAAGLTLHMKQYKEKDTTGRQPDASWAPAPPAEAESTVIHFDQVITGGLKGTAETRYMNGLLHEHSDWVFGTVETQNLFRPYAEIVALPDEHLSGKSKKSSPWLDEGIQLCTEARSASGGWVAKQVWGFQNVTVGGKPERRFCRNVVVTKGKDRVEARLVMDYIGEDA